VVAAAAILLLGGGVIGFALLPGKGGKGSLPAAGQPGAVLPAGVNAPRRLKLLVPAYFYPAGAGLAQWDRLLGVPDPAAVVVIANPNSGPGKGADPSYVRVLDRALQEGFTVIGYVPTRYAVRPLGEVKGDIDRWARLYRGVRGIFVDEQASAADQIDYYAALYGHAHKEVGLGLVINNPGTASAEGYLARPAADVVCLVESAKDFSTFQPPAWASGYPAARFGGFISGTDDPARMKRYVEEMVAKGVGYCYVTDGQGPNPWDRLPRYWEAEVEAVQQVNARGAGAR
jgi:hypothetical protein